MVCRQLPLFEDIVATQLQICGPEELKQELRLFSRYGKNTSVYQTRIEIAPAKFIEVDTFANEFWTSKQRAANSLHEISYRACFKPQLPRFFIERLTKPEDVVYDPFMGRGTTLLEAAMLGRTPFGCDVNPLCGLLLQPRLEPPLIEEIKQRLGEIGFQDYDEFPEELLVFYHPETLKEICSLKKYLVSRDHCGLADSVDRWIRMVAINRLTGHSPGFFSVYTLPPNQAVSVASQKKINRKRSQTPPRRHIPDLIMAKSRSLLADCDAEARHILKRASRKMVLVTSSACQASGIRASEAALVVTSPPFLDIVNYAADNWLRCWFCGIDPGGISITMAKKLDDWQAQMLKVFKELARILKPGGHVAFEVGEVRGGRLKLEEAVAPCGFQAGLEPVLILINSQQFTKTSNCWGIKNSLKGTNTNRIVLFRKPDKFSRKSGPSLN